MPMNVAGTSALILMIFEDDANLCPRPHLSDIPEPTITSSCSVVLRLLSAAKTNIDEGGTSTAYCLTATAWRTRKRACDDAMAAYMHLKGGVDDSKVFTFCARFFRLGKRDVLHAFKMFLLRLHCDLVRRSAY